MAWSDADLSGVPAGELLERLEAFPGGLTAAQASERLRTYGYNELAKTETATLLRQVLSKFLNPLVALLILLGVLSVLFGQTVQAVLILLMILLSVLLSSVQEYRSGREAEKLRSMIRVTATVLRGGRAEELPLREVVPGDVVELRAGDMIPADSRVLSAKDFFVDQSSITGESFPAEKRAGAARLAGEPEFANVLFMGTSVVSGTARAVAVRTGASTKFGKVSQRVAAAGEESDFDRGIRQFVWLMIRFIVVLVAAIFAVNVALKGEVLEAFLFSLAVAVGLTPEMLPMVVTVNLSRGAIALSTKKVIVKRLAAIQNLGAMDVLCTDKTGTLTMNRIILERHCDAAGRESEEVFRLAYLNSFHQTGLKNLLDQAVLSHDTPDTGGWAKVDEIPFDFSRRIMSVVVEGSGGRRMVSKGAAEEIFKRCASGESLSGAQSVHDKLSADGFRVLAVAVKEVPLQSAYSKEDERGMTLKGFVAFLDPPKASAPETIAKLESMGIRFVVLTGDNELVTRKICREVGLDAGGLLTGDAVEAMDDAALGAAAEKTAVFARLSPLQKERVIRALGKRHVVGYLGDGINDAPSLKAADVGVSVDNAVDIAKESADVILLEKNLIVLADGVAGGRKTFANTMKYVRMGASSNLGNMISMAAASLFLPFLPMTPLQILLNNFLYDVSQTAIPTDEVDEDSLRRPRAWDIGSIRQFMLVFGPVSSVFDFATFGALRFLGASPEQFRTGWFLESLVTEVLVIYVIRTAKRPFLDSRPSALLSFAGLSVVAVGFAAAASPFGRELGFAPPPPGFYAALAGIVLAYLAVSQAVKSWYVRRYGY